jgi:hypothetical protein
MANQFHVACVSGDLRTIIMLVETLDFDIKFEDDLIDVALFHACGAGHLDVVKYIFEMLHETDTLKYGDMVLRWQMVYSNGRTSIANYIKSVLRKEKIKSVLS